MFLTDLRDIPLNKDFSLLDSLKLKCRIAEEIKTSISTLPNYLRCDYFYYFWFHNLGSKIFTFSVSSQFVAITAKEKFPKSRNKMFANICIQSVENSFDAKFMHTSNSFVLTKDYSTFFLRVKAFLTAKFLIPSFVACKELNTHFRGLNSYKQQINLTNFCLV